MDATCFRRIQKSELGEINIKMGTTCKTMNQGHPAEVSQVGSLEEKSNVSGSFGHGTQTSHLVRFLSQEFYRAYYTLFSSENTN